MTARDLPWRTSPTGVRLIARVTPKAAQDGVDGMVHTSEGLALKVRVRAVADKGAANAAVEKVVAGWLGVARTRVSIVQGGKSRTKTLDIGGAPRELEPLIAARIGALR